MKPATIEQAADQLVKAKQAQEQALGEFRVAEDKSLRICEEIQALGIEPQRLGEAIKKLEQEIEAKLAA